MPDRLDLALDEFESAIGAGDAEAMCHSSRVVYAFAVEAALTPNGRWERVRPRVRQLFERALAHPSLRAHPDGRYAANVSQRFSELDAYLGEPAAPASRGLVAAGDR